MAQNKKTKVDFSTALKAKAEELAPKPAEANPDEEFLANINGEDVRFVRGDSTDAEWEAIKARPAAVQRVTVKPSPSAGNEGNITRVAPTSDGKRRAAPEAKDAIVTRKSGETDAEWRSRAQQAEEHPRYDGTVESTDLDQTEAKRAQYKALIQNEAYSGGTPESGALVTAEELKMLRAMDGDTAAKFVEERIKKREYADEQKRSDSQKLKDDPNERPPTIDLGLKKPDQGTPSEWNTPDSGAKMNLGTQTEMSPVSSAGPGMSPRAQMQSMMTGATGNPMLDDIQEVAQPVVDSVKKQIAGPPVDQIPLAHPNNPLNPINPASWTGPAKNIAELYTQPVTDGGAMPGQPIPAGRNPDGTAAMPVADPTVPPTDSGSLSASASLRVPGGFTPAQEDPKFAKDLDDSIAGAKQRAVDLQDLQAANEVVQDGIVRETGKRRLEAEAQMNAEAGLAAQAKLNAVNEAQRYNGARQAALDAAQKASQTPTDPNRYWNNKSDGQKAAAVIAGALFGFTGQGMNWLQRIDGLIENDMRVQTADRSSKVQGLESQARGYGEAADFAMKAGASEAEAHVIARQMKLESLNSYLQQMTMKSTNMQQKVTGQQMLLELQGKMAALDQQALAVNAQSTAQKNENLYRNATLAQGAAKISAHAAAAGGKARAVSPQLASRIGNTEQMISALENMRDLAKNGGLMDRMGRRVGEELSSEEAGKADQYKAQQFIIARSRAGSSLQKPEQEALLNLTRPRSGRFDPVPGIDQALKAAKRALAIDQKLAQDATAGQMGTEVPVSSGADDFGFSPVEMEE